MVFPLIREIKEIGKNCFLQFYSVVKEKRLKARLYRQPETLPPFLKTCEEKNCMIILWNLRNQEGVGRVSQSSFIFFLTKDSFELLLF
jgi:hypothetical protein